MKFTWMKWGVLPVAVLLAGGVAIAQDPSSQQSQQQQTQQQQQGQTQQSSQAQSGGSANSATPASTPAAKPKPTIAQRKEHQQDRIANGVQSGLLTAGESANLEKKEAAIYK